MKISKTKSAFSIMAMIGICQTASVAADDNHRCIDWTKLNLSSSQSQQIHALEDQWYQQYNQIRPEISEDQAKLTRLLADHNADPVEIMAMQQAVARKKEQLNGIATANYLKKRAILNESQQQQLEQMVRQVVVARQHQLGPSAQTEVMPDHMQDLIQRVRNIWPVSQER